ncbi:phosphotriesterase-related protein [Oscillospiraceae bacterium PP1C4]
MIETVLGPIAANELGTTMCHEHLAIDLSAVRQETDSTFVDTALITQELKKMCVLGAQAVIEVTGNDMGRDVIALRQYAKETGLHIVASTGFYLEPYHSDWLHCAEVDAICDIFVAELTQGIEQTGIRAGLIAEIATSTNRIAKTEEKVFLAAAKASVQTNCAISTHCDMGTQAKEQLKMLLGNGVTPDKVILGHVDLTDDTNYHLELLEQGANLAFDTIGKIKYLSDQKRAENLMALLNKGYEDHILLSQDVSRLSYLTANGGAGYTAVLGYFTQLLKACGATKAQIEKLLVHNPARILDR